MRSGSDRPRLISEDPFLFFQDPPDWRWLSFAEAGKRIEQWQTRLADPETRAGCEIPESPSVEALLSDLAARSRGLVTAQLPDADLEGAVDRLERVVGGSRVGNGQRSIVVHGRSLAERSERVVVEWAVRSAAAIVVAPTPDALVATAFWVRPTVLHGSVEDLEAWPRLFRAGEHRESGLVSRFRRLRHVVVVGDGALGAETKAFYTGLGADVVRLEVP